MMAIALQWSVERLVKSPAVRAAVIWALAAQLGCMGGSAIQKEYGQEHLTRTLTGYEVMGPYVPAGTVFTAVLLDDLTGPEQTFRASIREALYAPDGTVVVVPGAVVEGRTEARNDRNVVVFTNVRLLQGTVPLVAQLASSLPVRARRGTPIVVELTRPLLPPGSSYR